MTEMHTTAGAIEAANFALIRSLIRAMYVTGLLPKQNVEAVFAMALGECHPAKMGQKMGMAAAQLIEGWGDEFMQFVEANPVPPLSPGQGGSH